MFATMDVQMFTATMDAQNVWKKVSLSGIRSMFQGANTELVWREVTMVDSAWSFCMLLNIVIYSTVFYSTPVYFHSSFMFILNTTFGIYF